MFDAIVFAGGGNRCYWQGGFYEAAAERLDTPSLAVGVSAGAFACIYSLLGIGSQVRERVLGACGPHLRNVDFAAWRAGGRLYPVGAMYRALLDAVIDDRALQRLRALIDLRIAISRLPKGLSSTVGAAIGIAAYQVEKRLFHPVHPRFGRKLGFRPEFVRVRELSSAAELCNLVIASSGVPPFMPVVEINGRPALDGGLVDNVPVEPLDEIESAGGRSLVLLTRRYDRLPTTRGRTYVQPSRRIPARQFDVTDPDSIRDAYQLGLRDGLEFAKSRILRDRGML
jgi:predicted acylesterase/phospholipase RssA